MTNDLFTQAVEHHRAGRLPDAERIYRQILTGQPQHVGALHFLGLIAIEAGQNQAAADLIGRAVALRPRDAEARNNLGNALKNLGQLDQAIAAFRKSSELNPQLAAAFSNLGIALHDRGDIDEAIAACRRAVSIQPDLADAHNNLGCALKTKGDYESAIAEFQTAADLRPQWAGAYENLGNALRMTGYLQKALAAGEKSVSLDPNSANAHNNLGVTLVACSRLDDAVIAFRRALELSPNHDSAMSNLATALRDLGFFTEAIAAYEKILSIWPDLADVHSNLIFATLYAPKYDARAVADEAARWNIRHAEPLRRSLEPYQVDFDENRPLRIGYVSPDFRDHVVARNILPLLRQHDRSQFEVYCYSQATRHDAMTRELQRHTTAWRDIAGLTDEQTARHIREDRIDILVDLALHSGYNRLKIFALKPAPVQVCFAGYPGTTGLTTIDYRLSDPYLDPPGMDESVYSEKTIRLPHSFWCYDPLDHHDISVNPLPAVRNGYVTFGCLSSFYKLNDIILSLWVKVLQNVSGSHLRMLAPHASQQQRASAFFARNGIDPQRISFIQISPRRQYLEQYHQIDIGLDSFPYNGHTTSLDSFWMGVPVVTLVGQTAVSRAGWCQLSNLKLTELAGQTPEAFVKIAVDLANDLPRLASLRSTLRQRMEQSPLMDAAGFARSIESAYQQMRRTTRDRFKFALQQHREGNLKFADGEYQAILAESPEDAEALLHLGLIAGQAGRDAIAADLIRRCIALRPDYAEAYMNLGVALKNIGDIDGVIAACQKAVELNPDLAEAYCNLAAALNDLGMMDDAIAAHRRAIVLRPDNARFHSNLIYALLFHPADDAQSISTELREWNRIHAESLRQLNQTYTNDRDPYRRLRVGYVSPDLRDNVVGHNLLPLLRLHDRGSFEIVCYSRVSQPDRMTEEFRKHSDHWRDAAGFTDDQLAEQTRLDQIDLLVDLTLHMINNQLMVFARKPAPVQVTFAGYPGSTGLTAMDYRLSDPYLDPVGMDESVYSEQTIRLPHSFWCYDPMEYRDIPVGPLPSLSNGIIHFGCLNSFLKVNETIFALWMQVLKGVPLSRLLLLAPLGGQQRRIADMAARHGIGPQRLIFVSMKPRQEYLKLYHQIDIGLDSFPYNGHTTSLDSFWMGVPVVTLVGRTAVSRAGWCQLSNLGLTELAADTPEHFVQIAVGLARDVPRLASLRSTLRHRMESSPLMDAAGFTRGIEAAYRTMWLSWCEGRS